MQERDSQITTKWIVITGGPGVGKSTTLNALGHLGYETRCEAARLWIDEEMSKNKTLTEIRKPSMNFQIAVNILQEAAEARSDPKKTIFWDRAKPDTLAYVELFETSPLPESHTLHLRRYHSIFLLDPLPRYNTDYARFETETDAKRIQEKLTEVYTRLGYDVVQIPVRPVLERAQLILNHLALS